MKELVRWRKPQQARKAGVFLAEGRREIGRAASAGLTVRWVVGRPMALEALPLDPLVERRTATGPVMERVLGFHDADSADAAVAVVERPDAVDPAGLWARVPGRRLALIAEGVEKPGNLGAMVRTASAMGCGAVEIGRAHV